MKYYSEITKNFYNTEEECLNGEQIYQKKVKEADEKKEQLIKKNDLLDKQINDKIIKLKSLKNNYLKQYEEINKTIEDLYNKKKENEEKINNNNNNNNDINSALLIIYDILANYL